MEWSVRAVAKSSPQEPGIRQSDDDRALLILLDMQKLLNQWLGMANG